MKTPKQTDREAAALRANLLKRKARQRALESAEQPADNPAAEDLPPEEPAAGR